MSVGRCISRDYDMLVLEGGREGRECVVRGLVMRIMDVGWGLIGSSEDIHSMM